MNRYHHIDDYNDYNDDVYDSSRNGDDDDDDDGKENYFMSMSVIIRKIIKELVMYNIL